MKLRNSNDRYRQENTVEDVKNGQEVAKHAKKTEPRFHVDYWKKRIYRKTFTRGRTRHEVQEYSVRLAHCGHREAFALNTHNAAAAAEKARTIAVFLAANGWDATRLKFKPKAVAKISCPTIGEFLKNVEERAGLKLHTFVSYTRKLRKIVSDIVHADANLKGRARRRKHDYVNGGREAWVKQIDDQRLDILNEESLRNWRIEYLARIGNDDPLKRASAERTVSSNLRCSRALFSANVLSSLSIPVTVNPFKGIRLKDPPAPRYRSEINPQWLLACAERELRTAHPEQFIALILTLVGGMRRGEADNLTWPQVLFSTAQISIRRTLHFIPKTAESERDIDMPQSAMAILREYAKTSTTEFVLPGGMSNIAGRSKHYRAASIWQALAKWLGEKGVTARAKIHSLRKESGSLIADVLGIEAARMHLGHRDIRVTSQHYIGKKRRIEVSLDLGPVPPSMPPNGAHSGNSGNADATLENGS